jgi:hypothetical protein
MLHYATLIRATLTASLFVMPMAKAALAGPFENAWASAPSRPNGKITESALSESNVIGAPIRVQVGPYTPKGADWSGPFTDRGGVSDREKDRNSVHPRPVVTTTDPPCCEGFLSRQPSRTSVPLKAGNGIFAVPVEVNGTMTVDFAVDSGAAVVVVSTDVFSALKRVGTVTVQ